MEPERRESHTNTYVERERRTGGGTTMAFIVGGLVVAVALIALVFWGGGFTGGDVDTVGVSTQDQTPVVAVPAAPVENNVEIKTAPAAPAETTPAETTPAAPAEPAPAAPAQN